MEYYFAYGSNMSFDRMAERIGSYTFIGVGILNGYSLVFNKRSKKDPSVGFANIVESDGWVEGFIYSLDSIKPMDKYEGFPKHYERRKMGVSVGGSFIECWVYIANPEMVEEGLKPTSDYLGFLLENKLLLSPEYSDFLSSHK